MDIVSGGSDEKMGNGMSVAGVAIKAIFDKQRKTSTQFLIPVREDTKRMLELLKFEAQVREKKRVSYDELVKELMTCGSEALTGNSVKRD